MPVMATQALVLIAILAALAASPVIQAMQSTTSSSRITFCDAFHSLLPPEFGVQLRNHIQMYHTNWRRVRCVCLLVADACKHCALTHLAISIAGSCSRSYTTRRTRLHQRRINSRGQHISAWRWVLQRTHPHACAMHSSCARMHAHVCYTRV